MSDDNGINAPAFTAAIVIARHAPAELCAVKTERQDNNCIDKALRITTPRLTTCNRTAASTANCSVITTRGETGAHGANVLKCIPTVSADL